MKIILEYFCFNDYIINIGLATYSAIVYFSNENMMGYIMVTEFMTNSFY